ncbi:MAG: IS1595 family transposase, partial [Rhodobacteraceae bacterium]|nr:IS1595 family transposase [Paracoccaceae bacterium]
MTRKAPGKAFRQGLTDIEIVEMFPTDKAAEEWFEKQRWGRVGKPKQCPHCGCSGRIRKYENRRTSPYWCADCRSNFSVRTGTVMSHTRIPLHKWVIGIYLWSTSLKGVSSMRLHRCLGITQKSAWFMAQRIREAWKQDGGLFDGPIEFDETYIGGKRKNMPKSKREAMTGRGGVGKAIVAGAKDRDSDEVRAV